MGEATVGLKGMFNEAGNESHVDRSLVAANLAG